MSKVLTNYQVLVPTNVESLYKGAEVYSFEAEEYQSKTPEYIKKLLVESGLHSADIKVVRI